MELPCLGDLEGEPDDDEGVKQNPQGRHEERDWIVVLLLGLHGVLDGQPLRVSEWAPQDINNSSAASLWELHRRLSIFVHSLPNHLVQGAWSLLHWRFMLLVICIFFGVAIIVI